MQCVDQLPRLWKRLALSLAGALVCASALATPAEDIAQAVKAAGAAEISQAQPKQFLKAFTAVAFRASPRDLPEYVVAAVNMRPDLAPNIAAHAIKAGVRKSEAKSRLLCLLIERVVRAAIAANPEAAVAIAKASAAAAPELRECMVAAAISAAPDSKDAILLAVNHPSLPFAFLSLSAGENGGYPFTAQTLSPANISDLRDDNLVSSPEQPPAP